MLTENTEVRVKTVGFVQSDILKVRLEFPKDAGKAFKTVPAHYDHTTGDVIFSMPPLDVPQAAPAPDAEGGGEEAPAETEAPEALAGMEVKVELSLDG